jgi:hypothetical protein
MFNRASIISGILVLCTVGLVCAGVVAWRMHYMFMDYTITGSQFDEQKLKMVEERCTVAFPKGTRGLKMFYKGSSFTPGLAAKIQIPMQDQMAIEGELNMKTTKSVHVIDGPSTKVRWWNAETGMLLVDKKYMGGTDEMVQVHAILSKEGERLILYVECTPMY